ncbi:MAG TPA: arsenate reductase ArsC [Candidatus Binataceae bacterium]|nr:arsenate reductase ArsC [Candidatus Binataceae bacterium]
MSERVYNVLFLCTTNAARSIIAEAIIKQAGPGRFRGFSAGSRPIGSVNPLALELLQRLNFPTQGLRSKSWDEFAAPDAPHMDFVITVCDQAKGESCPEWPGSPITAHWGIPDPALAKGTSDQRMAEFRAALQALERRIRIFASLRLELLDKMIIKRKVDEIGKLETDTSGNEKK